MAPPGIFPRQARQVFDVTGAGDTVVGTLALALSTGAIIERRRDVWQTMPRGSSSAWSAPRPSRHNSSRRRSDMTKAAPSVMVVIPARYGSSRFPGKPLVELAGKPMIQHVYEQAMACRAGAGCLGRHRRRTDQTGGGAIRRARRHGSRRLSDRHRSSRRSGPHVRPGTIL